MKVNDSEMRIRWNNEAWSILESGGKKVDQFWEMYMWDGTYSTYFSYLFSAIGEILELQQCDEI